MLVIYITNIDVDVDVAEEQRSNFKVIFCVGALFFL